MNSINQLPSTINYPLSSYDLSLLTMVNAFIIIISPNISHQETIVLMIIFFFPIVLPTSTTIKLGILLGTILCNLLANRLGIEDDKKFGSLFGLQLSNKVGSLLRIERGKVLCVLLRIRFGTIL